MIVYSEMPLVVKKSIIHCISSLSVLKTYNVEFWLQRAVIDAGMNENAYIFLGPVRTNKSFIKHIHKECQGSAHRKYNNFTSLKVLPNKVIKNFFIVASE